MGFFAVQPKPPAGPSGNAGGVAASTPNSLIPKGTPVSGYTPTGESLTGVAGQFYHATPVATSLGPKSETAGGFRNEPQSINLAGVNNGTWNPYG